MLRQYFRLLLLLILPLCSKAQFYNGSVMEFGKNRVQYQDFFWSFYRFENFETHFYKGGEELAKYTSQQAQAFIPQMEAVLDYKLEDRLEFIVYNSHSDFKQSNIGLGMDENANIGGTTRIIGSKIFIFYEGDHAKLDEQIKLGIAQVILSQMMYGGSVKDMVRSATLLNLPQWYLDGLVSYTGQSWNDKVDNAVRDGILSGRYNKFNRLEGDDARFAGHSIWNYIAEVYGEKVIPNILYMARVSRSIESGFLFVLGFNLEQLTQEYLNFYSNRYEAEEQLRDVPTLAPLAFKTKKERVYQHLKLSPGGKYAVITSNQLGQYRIYVKDLKTGKQKLLLKGDHKMLRLTDYSFPVIAWHPSGEILAFVLEKKGKLEMYLYNLKDGEKSKREIFQLDKILDMDYANDGKTMVLSAASQGQTDLYRYYIIGNRQEKLTDDIYDDLNPHFAANDSKVVFVSNRPSDTLGAQPPSQAMPMKDVYVLKLKPSSNYLDRITNTPEEDETQPYEYGERKYTYLSNRNGVVNRFYAKYDSTILSVDTAITYTYYSSTYPLSNFNRSILDYHVNVPADQFSALMFSNGKYKFYTGKISEDEVVSLAEIRRAGLKSIKQIDFDNLDEQREIVDTARVRAIAPEIEEDNEQETYKILPKPSTADTLQPEIDINDYQFGSDKPLKKNPFPPAKVYNRDTVVALNTDKIQDFEAQSKKFQMPLRQSYRINFATDYVLTQVDNNFNNQFYQLYTGPDNLNPGLSGYLKLGASDLFEDYKVVGGVRLSGGFDNLGYIFQVQDLKRRVDKVYTFQRQTIPMATLSSLFKLTTHVGSAEFKYPFSEVAAMRLTGSLRQDITDTLTSENTLDLQKASQRQYQTGLKLEYIYDNTLKRGINSYTGTRLKLFAEYYQSPKVEKSDFKVFGFDIRHYEKIHRSLILATRLSAGTSTGNRRLVFFLGGVDSWLYLPSTEPSTPPPSDPRFYYQTLAAPMRGFLRNKRNGNSFAALNAELRWPIFKYLANKPLKSDFLETFQIVGFTDVGTAWTGKSPYSDDNQFNTTVLEREPFTIRLRTQRDPIVMGYGVGLRARLLGYYVRADWAYGREDGIRLPRVFYLSLSLDF